MSDYERYLFRGKEKDSGKWIYGDLRHISDGHGGYILCIVDNTNGRNNDVTGVEVLPETVGQYTGLTDKNGVRIFEGDIVSLVKHDSLIYKVVYVPCRYELVNSKGVNCFVLDIYKSENIEVIGNIYDNPELLGGENNGINR